MAAPLNPASLCNIVRQTINAETGLKNPYDGLAALTNACMISTGFKFIGLNEDEKAAQAIDAENLAPLPADWNASSSASYSFRYTHSQSSMEFIIRVSRLGKKTVLYGIAIDDDKTCTVDLKTQDYTSENFYPWAPKADAEALANGFISLSRIKDFTSLVKLNIIQKLIPGLNKEGYTESTPAVQSSSQPTSSSQPPRPTTFDPLRDDRPRNPFPRPSDWPPEFEDEHQLQRPFRMPGSFGADDLNPPGIGSIIPGRHRGMYPHPDEIIGGYGTPTFPSRGAPPPGARYDPVFPSENMNRDMYH